MKKALVATGQLRCDGYAIVEVVEVEFGVSIPFFWVDCEDDASPSSHYYSEDKTVKRIDLQPCHIKAKAKQLLMDTDWTALIESEGVDQYLQNKDAFVFYRNILRNIAIDPKPVSEWPVVPFAVWAANSGSK